MIVCLNSSEKEELFENARMSVGKISKKDDQKVLVTLDYNNDKSFPILSFGKKETSITTVIRNLQQAQSDISELTEVFIAVCYKAIDRLINLSRIKSHKRIVIFTKDPFIQEILLEKRFTLTSHSKNIDVVMARYDL